MLQLSADSKMKIYIIFKLFISLTVENCKKYDTIMVFSIVEIRFNPADLKRFRSHTKKILAVFFGYNALLFYFIKIFVFLLHCLWMLLSLFLYNHTLKNVSCLLFLLKCTVINFHCLYKICPYTFFMPY